MPQLSPEWLGMGRSLIIGMFEKRCYPQGQRLAAALALRAA